MAIRIPWSDEEIALLLFYAVILIRYKPKRSHLVDDISTQLRILALNNGIDIDDKFRNQNGISLQLQGMTDLILHKSLSLRKPSKDFFRIAQLYESNFTAYVFLLLNARLHIESNNSFLKLKNAISHHSDNSIQFAEFTMCILEFDEVLIRNHITDLHIWDVESVQKVEHIIWSFKNNNKLLSSFLAFHNNINFIECLVKEIIDTNNTSGYLIPKTNNTKEEFQLLQSDAKEQLFFKYLIQKKPANASDIYLSLQNVNAFAIKNNVVKTSIIEELSNPLIDQLESLIDSDTLFKSKNRGQLFFIRQGLKLLREFAKSNIPTHDEIRSNERVRHSDVVTRTVNSFTTNSVEIASELSEDINSILRNNFSNGLANNPIHMDLFRECFRSEYNEQIPDDDDALFKIIRKVGMELDGKIFTNNSSESSALSDTIKTCIVETLNGGASCIYYDCLLKRYAKELSEQLNVFNVNSLISYLKRLALSEIRLGDEYLYKGFKMPNVSDDVQEALKKSHAGLTYNELSEKLWNIPVDKIKAVLRNEPVLVYIDQETYMYAYNIPINENELAILSNVMMNRIHENGYLVASDIMILIERYCPSAYINLTSYKDYAVRNAISYILRDKFVLKGSFLCEKGKDINVKQAYHSLCHNSAQITLQELEKFADDIGYNLNLSFVLDDMIRISKNKYIPRTYIRFDVMGIDSALEEIVTGKYMMLKDITLFLQFPALSVPWNGFILESYLIKGSKKFKLLHKSLSKTDYYGIVVPITSEFASYEDVLVDILADSDKWFDDKSAIEYLVSIGCQERKKLSAIDDIIKRASLLKEKNKE